MPDLGVLNSSPDPAGIPVREFLGHFYKHVEIPGWPLVCKVAVRRNTFNPDLLHLIAWDFGDSDLEFRVRVFLTVFGCDSIITLGLSMTPDLRRKCSRGGKGLGGIGILAEKHPEACVNECTEKESIALTMHKADLLTHAWKGVSEKVMEALE
jgi:hypothetical protein